MILVDAGPLIALVHRDDQHHEACIASFGQIRTTLATVWPVLAEAMYLPGPVAGGQAAVWDLIEKVPIEIVPLDKDDVPRIRELMAIYADLPMDLADAALVRVAEREGTRDFFTIDRRDFAVYRLHGRVKPRMIP